LVNRQQASSTRQIVGLLNALILLLGDEHMHEKSVTRNMHSNIRDFGGVVKLVAIAQSNLLSLCMTQTYGIYGLVLHIRVLVSSGRSGWLLTCFCAVLTGCGVW
jgi:hypothetical protein